MGEMEIVYKLKVTNGKITGSQGLPFGESPITDGEVTGDSFTSQLNWKVSETFKSGKSPAKSLATRW